MIRTIDRLKIEDSKKYFKETSIEEIYRDERKAKRSILGMMIVLALFSLVVGGVYGFLISEIEFLNYEDYKVGSLVLGEDLCQEKFSESFIKAEYSDKFMIVYCENNHFSINRDERRER